MWLPFTRNLVSRLFHRVGPAQAKALRPNRNVLSLFVAQLEEARLKIVDIVSVCAGVVVRQGTLVALRRLPCARGRVY